MCVLLCSRKKKYFPFLADLSDLDPNADLKSPISLVHEIALKRNLTVAFEVIRESGPPHVRTFVTVCIVGEYRTEGEGTGKKVCVDYIQRKCVWIAQRIKFMYFMN